MTTFTLNVLLALAWAALSSEFTPQNVLVGFVLGYLLLWRFSGTLNQPNYFVKLPKFIAFLGFFLWELIKANVRVTLEVLTPKFHMRPAVVAIPLSVHNDLAITILANIITLTPGTLSLDISDDKRVLYVHALYVDDVDAFRRGIKQGFERRVKELFE